MKSLKKRIILIVFSSISFCLILFLVLYFNIPRFNFEKMEDEVFITDYYGNKKDIVIPSFYDGLPVTAISSRALEKKKMRSLTFKEDCNVRVIERLSFNACPNLEELIFPLSLVEIENNAFMECSSLKKVVFNDGLLFVGGSAFFRCERLKDVTLSNTILLLGSYAFYECTSLEEITIPSSCRSVYNNVFSYCSSLKKIYVHLKTTLHENYKQNCNAETIIID